MSMEDIAEQVGLPPPPDEIPIPSELPKKRARKSRKLAWNERQYGAGLVAGISIGIIIGIPIDVAVAILSKMFVNWLIAW